MSTNNFVKGACRQCAGHLEFPADAAGETAACPHCGQPTELVALILPNKLNGSRRRWLGIGLAAAAILIALAAAFLGMHKVDHAAAPAISTIHPAQSNGSHVSLASPIVQTNPPIETRTNDFALLPFKLEKTPGSSLVYVIGTLRNLSSRQRFGVKVEFGLFDINDVAVGTATDYQRMLEPNGDWHFKALVMQSKTASARLNSILEDQQ